MPRKPAQPSDPVEEAPVGLPLAIPMTKSDTLRALAEMCATPGWQHVFIPTLRRKREQVFRAIVNADDINRNFAAEIAALKLLDGILNTQSNNQKLIDMLGGLL